MGWVIWCRRFEPGLFQGFSLLMYYYVVPRPTLPVSNLFLSVVIAEKLKFNEARSLFSFLVSKVITTVHSHKVSFFFVGPSRELLLRPWLDHYK